MRSDVHHIWLLFLLAFIACRKPYIAPVQERPNQFLVVDGIINLSPNSKTRFTLTYTKNLADTAVVQPISNARVQVVDKNGNGINLNETAVEGVYESDQVTLSAANEYSLLIETVIGKRYQSAFVTGLTAPPIDSIAWEESPDLNFYVYTSDPSNQLKYYRWQFEEVYETRAQTPSFWAVVNGKIQQADETSQTASCWITQFSTDLLIGTTAGLSSAQVHKLPLLTIRKPDKRMAVRYSMLLTQFAISAEAYQYFRILKQNSQELGGIFDPMPSQLVGNIKSVSHPDEPVIGFVSAGQVSTKRIFISRLDLNNWPFMTTAYDCMVIGADSNPIDYQIYDYPDPTYWFWYFSSGTPPGLVLSKKVCIDCRLSGGTNLKPSFW